jgi:hypothetical protein
MWGQVKEALAQATAHFLTRSASLLPGLVALVLALVVSLFVAWVLAVIIRRVLVGMHFDEHLVRWGFPASADSVHPNPVSRLVARAIGLLVVLAGFLIGLAAFDSEWTTLFARRTLEYIPNLLGALLILLIGSVVARFLARSVLIGGVNMNLQYARLLSVGVKWMVLVLAVAMALEDLRIARSIVELAFGILFGGIVLALALAVGLGSKDLVSKSLERDVRKVPREPIEEPLRHL